MNFTKFSTDILTTISPHLTITTRQLLFKHILTLPVAGYICKPYVHGCNQLLFIALGDKKQITCIWYLTSDEIPIILYGTLQEKPSLFHLFHVIHTGPSTYMIKDVLVYDSYCIVHQEYRNRMEIGYRFLHTMKTWKTDSPWKSLLTSVQQLSSMYQTVWAIQVGEKMTISILPLFSTQNMQNLWSFCEESFLLIHGIEIHKKMCTYFDKSQILSWIHPSFIVFTVYNIPRPHMITRKRIHQSIPSSMHTKGTSGLYVVDTTSTKRTRNSDPLYNKQSICIGYSTITKQDISITHVSFVANQWIERTYVSSAIDTLATCNSKIQYIQSFSSTKSITIKSV